MSKHLIVGLGNPGAKYSQTRHNLGVRAVQAWIDTVGAKALQEQGVSFLLPIESMNNSGQAVAAYLHTAPIATESILIVHDDMELPLGEVKMIPGGSARGHNGVKSIQEALSTKDIPRVRLGVGRPPEGVAPSDFVLERFGEGEREMVQQMIVRAGERMTEFVLDKIPNDQWPMPNQ